MLLGTRELSTDHITLTRDTYLVGFCWPPAWNEWILDRPDRVDALETPGLALGRIRGIHAGKRKHGCTGEGNELGGQGVPSTVRTSERDDDRGRDAAGMVCLWRPDSSRVEGEQDSAHRLQ
jgi:hypothetical protein